MRTTILPLALFVVGLAGMGWSSTQLSARVSEIPQHWWSAAASVPAFAGVALLVAKGYVRRVSS